MSYFVPAEPRVNKLRHMQAQHQVHCRLMMLFSRVSVHIKASIVRMWEFLSQVCSSEDLPFSQLEWTMVRTACTRSGEEVGMLGWTQKPQRGGDTVFQVRWNLALIDTPQSRGTVSIASTCGMDRAGRITSPVYAMSCFQTFIDYFLWGAFRRIFAVPRLLFLNSDIIWFWFPTMDVLCTCFSSCMLSIMVYTSADPGTAPWAVWRSRSTFAVIEDDGWVGLRTMLRAV